MILLAKHYSNRSLLEYYSKKTLAQIVERALW